MSYAGPFMGERLDDHAKVALPHECMRSVVRDEVASVLVVGGLFRSSGHEGAI